MEQQGIDRKNTEFWNELCGAHMAKAMGMTEVSPESLARFDQFYFAYYPYLLPYVTRERLEGKKVLEIGIGYGTVGHALASRRCDYHGVDIAPNPVAMMNYRLQLLGLDAGNKVRIASVLELPFNDGTFDYVYSIGCLHHTGDLPRAVNEVHRVLVPGGRAIVMLYNRYSFRRLVHVPWQVLRRLFSPHPDGTRDRTLRERIGALYDTNPKGDAAPCTEYVSRCRIWWLFRRFSKVRIDTHNFDTYVFSNGKRVIHREKLLNNIARVLGLDHYVVAVK
ncbi:MAG: class I SAM-dependent methyltransferase [Planctomycetes bacterium]|nr:class I SAM-dependent methyltransferase [Planctomycetota bacterium]